MPEVLGRLSALDPEATETLKVIAYFDALVAGGVGTDALLRGAAVLSVAVAGFAEGRRHVRLGADGVRLVGGSDADGLDSGTDVDAWPVIDLPSGGRVWIERMGPPHANDAMVLERLSLAMSALAARAGRRALMHWRSFWTPSDLRMSGG